MTSCQAYPVLGSHARVCSCHLCYGRGAWTGARAFTMEHQTSARLPDRDVPSRLPSVHIPYVVHLGRRPPLPNRTSLMGLGPRCILWHHHMMPCTPRRPLPRRRGRLLRGGTRRGESGLGSAANEEHAGAAHTFTRHHLTRAAPRRDVLGLGWPSSLLSPLAINWS